MPVQIQTVHIPTGVHNETLEYEEWNPDTFRQGQTKVSVYCITYNHGNYIEDALKGFLMQKTDFPFEVVVIDDASRDNTQDILKRYAEKYPDVFHLFLARENCFCHPQRQYIYTYLVENYLKAPYIAYCDGDDYWTSPHKLQKQIDFLETHQEFSATAHNVRCVDENENLHHGDYGMYPIRDDYIYTVNSAYRYEMVGQTASLVHRNILDFMEMSNFYNVTSRLIQNGDMLVQINLAFRGPIYFFHDIMADHRRVFDHGDSYTAWAKGKNLWWRNYCIQRDLKKMMDLQDFDTTGFCSNLDSYYQKALKFYRENPTEDNKAVIEQFENEIQEQEKIDLYKKKNEEAYSEQQLLTQLKKTQKMVDKHLDIARLYDIWLSGKDKGRSVDMVIKERGYDKIAIYGLGLLGTRLYNELKDSDVCVLYGIDQKKMSLSEEFHTYAPDELDLEDVSVPGAVVVTVFSEFESIKKHLEGKGFKSVLCIDELIYDLLKN